MPFCPFCEAVTGMDARFCTTCGRPLAEKPTGEVKSGTPGRSATEVTLKSLAGRVEWASYLADEDVRQLGDTRLPDGIPIGLVGVSVVKTNPLNSPPFVFRQTRQ